ncbi:MAG TPA: hypothetical protein VF041_19355 [Gemmatimonadaceae bacterium]
MSIDRRRASLVLVLAIAPTLPLSACDDPPTAGHPVVHRYVATTYDGRRLPTTLCPNAPPSDPQFDSLTIVTENGRQATITQVIYFPEFGQRGTSERGFTYVVRDDRMIELDLSGRDGTVFGTFTPTGIDVQVGPYLCAYGQDSSRRVSTTVHFAERY